MKKKDPVALAAALRKNLLQRKQQKLQRELQNKSNKLSANNFELV